MRLESTANEDRYKYWLTDDELEELRRATGSIRDDLVIQFGGFVELRAFEIPQVTPKHVKRTPRRRPLPAPRAGGEGHKPGTAGSLATPISLARWRATSVNT